MKGRKCCSRRRECTRTDRRACGALREIDGTHGPDDVLVWSDWTGEQKEKTHILRSGLALQEGLDGLVLLVELSKIGNEILDDVGVRKGVDAGLGLCVGRNAACKSVSDCGLG
jgi:hypothetical protein